jgi:PAS domain S-box-containing protein
MNCQPLVHPGYPQPCGVVASLRDITSSRRADEALGASEARYRLLWRATSEVLYEWDIQSNVVVWGPGLQPVLGYEEAEPSAAWWRERIHPDDREGVRRSLGRAMESGNETSHAIYRFLRADGSYGIVADRCVLVPGEGGHTARVIGAISDITVRKRAEDRLRLLSSIAMGIRSGMSVDDVIRYVVRQMHEHFPDLRVSYSSIDEEGRFQVQCCRQPPGMPDLSDYHGSLANSPILLEVYRRRGPMVFDDVQDNPVLQPIMTGWKTGTRTALAMPLQHGERLMGALTLGSPVARKWGQHEMDVLREVSDYLTVAIAEASAEQERERALRELETSRGQLRELAHQLQVAGERERTRVAREIHDVVGQALTALQMEVALLLQRQGRGRKLRQLIDVTIESVQRLVAGLRPSQLDDLGLRAAIEWALDEFQDRWGIRCEGHLAVENPPLTPEQSTAIFRVLQEALTNVARHAEADRVEVHLVARAESVRLDVADNGRGIAEAALSSPNSLGLIGMRERAVALGGRVEIRSGSGEGTRLTLILPLHPASPMEVSR